VSFIFVCEAYTKTAAGFEQSVLAELLAVVEDVLVVVSFPLASVKLRAIAKILGKAHVKDFIRRSVFVAVNVSHLCLT